jgi:hypothetical protein
MYPPVRYPFLKHLLDQDYAVILSTPQGVIYRRIDRHCMASDMHLIYASA